MKHFLTISALLVSSLAMGQWPSLPYNPDDNADGLIGVADLQALLANYGSEFSSVILPSDSSFAITDLGSMKYLECVYGCSSLPGKWSVISLEEAGFLLSQSSLNSDSWLFPDERIRQNSAIAMYVKNTGQISSYGGTGSTYNHQCYCAAKQLPRVEYSFCHSPLQGTSQLQECCDEKAANGWYPLGGIEMTNQSGSFDFKYAQAFWRWAE